MALGIKKQLWFGALASGLFSVVVLVAVGRVTAESMVRGPMYQQLSEQAELVADVLPPPAYVLETYTVSLELARATDPARVAALIERGNALAKDFDDRLSHWSGRLTDPELRHALLEEAQAPAREVFAIRDRELVPARQRNDEPAVAAAVAKLEAVYQRHRVAIDRVVARANALSKQTEDAASATLGRTRTLLWGMAAIALLGPIVVFGLIARRLGARLDASIAELRDSGHELDEAAGRVGTASSSLAQGASTQAASIEETSAALEEIATMTKRNAGAASESSAHTGEVRGGAEQSTERMAELVAAMDAIQASSDEIGKVIKVIDDIAFQTNMLALNAAVEAARAGEAGLGFAVVADEVRNLAQRSAQAARDTAAMIEESIRRSNRGVEITRDVHVALDGIATQVRKVDDLAHQISDASQEQARGIAQTNGAVAQLDRVTQQNAALADEVATTAGRFTEQAERVVALSGRLEQLVRGGHGDGRARPRAVAAPAAPVRAATTARRFPVAPQIRTSTDDPDQVFAQMLSTPDNGDEATF